MATRYHLKVRQLCGPRVGLCKASDGIDHVAFICVNHVYDASVMWPEHIFVSACVFQPAQLYTNGGEEVGQIGIPPGLAASRSVLRVHVRTEIIGAD